MYMLVREICRSRDKEQDMLCGKGALSVLCSRCVKGGGMGLSDILWWNKLECCRKCLPIKPLA